MDFVILAAELVLRDSGKSPCLCHFHQSDCLLLVWVSNSTGEPDGGVKVRLHIWSLPASYLTPRTWIAELGPVT